VAEVIAINNRMPPPGSMTITSPPPRARSVAASPSAAAARSSTAAVRRGMMCTRSCVCICSAWIDNRCAGFDVRPRAFDGAHTTAAAAAGGERVTLLLAVDARRAGPWRGVSVARRSVAATTSAHSAAARSYVDAGRDVIVKSDVSTAAIAMAASEFDVGWELMLGEPEADTTAARVGRMLAYIKVSGCAGGGRDGRAMFLTDARAMQVTLGLSDKRLDEETKKRGRK
jgi:hypothetical protein